MKSQVLLAVRCFISCEVAGEIWNWSRLGVSYEKPSSPCCAMFYFLRGCRGNMKLITLGSKLWKAKFSLLCDVIFLERLQGKLEIDHALEWHTLSTLSHHSRGFVIVTSRHSHPRAKWSLQYDWYYKTWKMISSRSCGRQAAWHTWRRMLCFLRRCRTAEMSEITPVM